MQVELYMTDLYYDSENRLVETDSYLATCYHKSVNIPVRSLYDGERITIDVENDEYSYNYLVYGDSHFFIENMTQLTPTAVECTLRLDSWATYVSRHGGVTIRQSKIDITNADFVANDSQLKIMQGERNPVAIDTTKTKMWNGNETEYAFLIGLQFENSIYTDNVTNVIVRSEFSYDDFYDMLNDLITITSALVNETVKYGTLNKLKNVLWVRAIPKYVYDRCLTGTVIPVTSDEGTTIGYLCEYTTICQKINITNAYDRITQMLLVGNPLNNIEIPAYVTNIYYNWTIAPWSCSVSFSVNYGGIEKDMTNAITMMTNILSKENQATINKISSVLSLGAGATFAAKGAGLIGAGTMNPVMLAIGGLTVANSLTSTSKAFEESTNQNTSEAPLIQMFLVANVGSAKDIGGFGLMVYYKGDYSQIKADHDVHGYMLSIPYYLSNYDVTALDDTHNHTYYRMPLCEVKRPDDMLYKSVEYCRDIENLFKRGINLWYNTNDFVQGKITRTTTI